MMMIVMSVTRLEVMMSMVLIIIMIIFNTKVMLMMIPYQGDTSLGLNTVM